MHDKSEKRAREILHNFVNEVSMKFEGEIEALILVGSLSNGSYVEGPGRDIDVITVLKDTTNEETRNSILKQIVVTEGKFNNDIPISRTVYRISEMKRPFKRDVNLSLENKHLLEITTELQRIHESGILIYGKDIIKELPVPTREEVIFFDKLGREWSEIELSKNPGIREMLNEPPINILVQIIITNAFRHYFYSTNKSCSNKHEIAFRMRQDVPNYRFQRALDIATKYKINPNEELPLEEYDELKKEYEELIKWRGPLPVDEVPLF